MGIIERVRRTVPDGKAVITIRRGEHGYLTRLTIDGEEHDEIESYTLADAEAWRDILLREIDAKAALEGGAR